MCTQLEAGGVDGETPPEFKITVVQDETVTDTSASSRKPVALLSQADAASLTYGGARGSGYVLFNFP